MVGVPISVEGRLWGVVTVSSTREESLPADTEARLAGFTELVATAIANAESQAQLTASRARIVAAADTARRRIERDLHDGAQQRLISLALRLRVAKAAAPPGAGELVAQLDSLVTEATGTLDELRELASGIHPVVLADGGLAAALKVLARRSAVPVELDVRVAGRLPEQIEVAAYYVVAEALTNAAKHAQASTVTVTVDTTPADRSDLLQVEVRDNGRGGAELTLGTGLLGLKDRVEALGGAITVESPRGKGTTLRVTLPITGMPSSSSRMPDPPGARAEDHATGAHLRGPAVSELSSASSGRQDGAHHQRASAATPRPVVRCPAPVIVAPLSRRSATARIAARQGAAADHVHAGLCGQPVVLRVSAVMMPPPPVRQSALRARSAGRAVPGWA